MDEGTQQFTERVPIPIDAGGGEVAKDGQETSRNLQRDAPRKRIRPLVFLA
jgi:hypothetical protein